MPSPTGQPPLSGKIIHLPQRSTQLFSVTEAAIYLGVSTRRLKCLSLVGGGPTQSRRPKGKPVYHRDGLDLYLLGLHTKAEISETEMTRRRASRAPQRGAALTQARSPSTHPHPPIDPFTMMATGQELWQHTISFVLKVILLLGFILLCLSPTPLLRTHFN